MTHLSIPQFALPHFGHQEDAVLTRERGFPSISEWKRLWLAFHTAGVSRNDGNGSAESGITITNSIVFMTHWVVFHGFPTEDLSLGQRPRVASLLEQFLSPILDVLCIVVRSRVARMVGGLW